MSQRLVGSIAGMAPTLWNRRGSDNEEAMDNAGSRLVRAGLHASHARCLPVMDSTLTATVGCPLPR